MDDSVFTIEYYKNKANLNIASNDVDRLGKTLVNSKISLNPHQIEASLKFLKSPFNKGMILADEVGLGKTIEAGLIISQYWCERKRQILIICPASLQKQWVEELEEKFCLKSEILDRKKYNDYFKKGYDNPFLIKNKIFICSINFASVEADNIRLSNVDLVVIDEAHNLRNVCQKKNFMAKNILGAVKNKKKIMLTATPFQNSLVELYGLSKFVDEDMFGELDYFKDKYIKNYSSNINELRERINTISVRTLRNQVEKYVKYSGRLAKTFSFIESKEESEFYEQLTSLILSEEFLSVYGKGRSQLLILIIRKLLSSSTYAVIKTLENLKNNLLKKDEIVIENEIMQELEEDLDEELDNEFENDIEQNAALVEKIEECINKGKTITCDTKAVKLLDAINTSFNIIEQDKKRNRKILIFTESRNTQDYLFEFLQSKGYSSVIKFNGTNNDVTAKDIFDEWSKEHLGEINNSSKSANKRQAILEAFKNKYDIMIATEAAAEGLNIQFCSIIVNYDMPWNPQRVEQRIGRCHRYGQTNDVVVINMLNESNDIDSRVYQLLSEKMNLFNNVFGSSDEILGNVEMCNDLQKNIIEIYKQCRTPEDINKAFDDLQKMYKEDIDSKIKETRQQLLDNFDEDLQNRFNNVLKNSEMILEERENEFWRILYFYLNQYGSFNLNEYTFEIQMDNDDFPKGCYSILKDTTNTFISPIDYRCSKLFSYNDKTLYGDAIFDLTNYNYKIGELELLKGHRGQMILSKVSIDSYEKEDYLVFDGVLEDGTIVDQETCQKLMRLYCKEYNLHSISKTKKLVDNHSVHIEQIINISSKRNEDLFAKEAREINYWAEDKIGSLQLKTQMMRSKRSELIKNLDYAINLEEQLKIQEDIDSLTKKISKSWMELSEMEEEVEIKRHEMVKKLKAEQMKKVDKKEIFCINFEVM